MIFDSDDLEITGEVLHFHQDMKPKVGQLLIAAGNMADPQFRHRVIFLCEHNLEGSFGLMINHPLPMKLSEVIAGNHSHLPLYQGGPVQTNTLHYLHLRNDLSEKSIEIIKGLYWGSDFDAILSLADEQAIAETDIRFFAGYTGWGPEQLENEITQGSWYLLEAKVDDVISLSILHQDETYWKQCLSRLGSKYKMIINYPIDPSLN